MLSGSSFISTIRINIFFWFLQFVSRLSFEICIHNRNMDKVISGLFDGYCGFILYCWFLQDDGSPVSIFTLSGNNAQDGHLAAGRNGVKRLRTVSCHIFITWFRLESYVQDIFSLITDGNFYRALRTLTLKHLEL